LEMTGIIADALQAHSWEDECIEELL